ncbi:MAG: hypothetical protein Q8K32_31380 [Archangium sp.]|nr:hypothetical protein [Archangium sp.]
MNFARVLTQTAYVAPVIGTDARGKPTYGPPVARKVRAEVRRTMVTKATGEEAVSNHRFWCVEPVNLTDRVWLPGEDNSSAEASHLPLSVESASDFPGTATLWKVML